MTFGPGKLSGDDAEITSATLSRAVRAIGSGSEKLALRISHVRWRNLHQRIENHLLNLSLLAKIFANGFHDSKPDCVGRSFGISSFSVGIDDARYCRNGGYLAESESNKDRFRE
jgi:hypothetical protein